MAKRFRWTRERYRRAHHLSRLLSNLLDWRSQPPPLVQRYIELWDQYPQHADPLEVPIVYRRCKDSVPF